MCFTLLFYWLIRTYVGRIHTAGGPFPVFIIIRHMYHIKHSTESNTCQSGVLDNSFFLWRLELCVFINSCGHVTSVFLMSHVISSTISITLRSLSEGSISQKWNLIPAHGFNLEASRHFLERTTQTCSGVNHWLTQAGYKGKMNIRSCLFLYHIIWKVRKRHCDNLCFMPCHVSQCHQMQYLSLCFSCHFL